MYSQWYGHTLLHARTPGLRRVGEGGGPHPNGLRRVGEGGGPHPNGPATNRFGYVCIHWKTQYNASYSVTQCSQVASHLSANCAWLGLTSEIGQVQLYSQWYGRPHSSCADARSAGGGKGGGGPHPNGPATNRFGYVCIHCTTQYDTVRHCTTQYDASYSVVRHIYVYICMYVCIYTHAHTHTHIYTL